MSEVKHLDQPLVGIDSVVNQNRAMQQLANARPLFDQRAHPRKLSQQLDMIQQGTAEARRRGCIVVSDVGDYTSQIIQRFLGVDEAEVH